MRAKLKAKVGAIPFSKFRGGRRMEYIKKQAASKSETACFILVEYILC
jgi:hypothetical protein